MALSVTRNVGADIREWAQYVGSDALRTLTILELSARNPKLTVVAPVTSLDTPADTIVRKMVYFTILSVSRVFIMLDAVSVAQAVRITWQTLEQVARSIVMDVVRERHQ